MAARFVLGIAGTGKTHWCIQRVIQAVRDRPLNSNIIWLAPRQATFGVQRILASHPDLGGYFRVQVVSFEDLGKNILAECGGASTPDVSSLGRRMILGHLLRKLGGKLQFFDTVAHHPGMAAELDVTFDELERYGLDANQLTQEPREFSPSLQAKLYDLREIYRAYSGFLGQDRLDPNRRLAEAMRSIHECPSLKTSEILVDGFYDFTLFERKVLAALAGVAKSLAITLTIDPESSVVRDPRGLPAELSVFHRSERAYQRLLETFRKEAVALEEPVKCLKPHRFIGRGLLEAQKDESNPIAQPSDIEMIIAPDRRGEVDATARWIRNLVSGDIRYRDIAVLMRNEDDYRELIAASFAEHGIPFFIDRRRTAAHHPLLRLIRAALAVARTGWSHDAVMSAIKTDLVGLTADEADELENFVIAHDLHHRAWFSPAPWTAGNNPERINEIRRKVTEPLGLFVRAVTDAQEIPVGQWAREVFNLLQQLKVPQRIVQWMEIAEKAGRLEERGEHERVWDEVVKLFDEMVELFGDEKITLLDFSAILDAALESFTLALTPPTVDQVLVGPVDRTRTGNVKACAVLGLGEGQFPRLAREGTVFSDADRKAMATQNIDLDPDTERQLLDEKFLAYIALSRASHKLLLTRSEADDRGRAIAASPIFADLESRGIEPRIVRREVQPPLASLATPRQLLVALMHWVRDGGRSGEIAPVYQWLATESDCPPAIDAIRYLSWKSLSYHNDAKLDSAQASAIFASPLRATFSQLETFRKCPYQHFARWGLGLRPRDDRNIHWGVLSTVYRQTLNRLVLDLIKTGDGWEKLNDQRVAKLIHELSGKVAAEMRNALMLETARSRYLLGHVQRMLGSVVAAQRAAAARGDFRPHLADVRFGNTGDPLGPLKLTTPSGKTVELNGKIDRIDILPDGAACVFDYAMEARPLPPTPTYFGLRLKLLGALLVLESAGQLTRRGKLAPAAVFCVQLLRENRSEDPDDALSPDDPKFHLRIKPRGIFDESYLRNLDRDIDGTSEVVQAMMKKDGVMGRMNYFDSCATLHFNALIRHIRRRIGETADEIMSGTIAIRPYRMGSTTPCPKCEYRALCRFEPRPRSYNDLPNIGRVDMLQRVLEENP